MSDIFKSAVWKCGIDPTRRFVLMALADEADGFGFAALENDVIVSKTGYSDKTVRASVDSLEDERWLFVTRRAIGGRWSTFDLNVKKLGVVLPTDAEHSKLWYELQRVKKAVDSGKAVYEKGGRLKFGKILELKTLVASGDLFGEMSPVAATGETAHEGTTAGVIGIATAGTDANDVDNKRATSTAQFISGKNPESPVAATGDPGGKPESPVNDGKVTGKSGKSERYVLPVTKISPVAATGDFAALSAAPLSSLKQTTTLKAKTTPLPPSKNEGGEAHQVSVAVVKVMRECNLSEPRLNRIIELAIRQHAAKTDEKPNWNAIAELMIAAQREYVACDEEHLLRFAVGVRKFISHGYWLDKGKWAFEDDVKKRMRDARRGVRL